jgi:hypothetical protein
VHLSSGESLWSFIQWFSQVRNTIFCISNTSVVVAFRQGMRDEKMLKKLATHDVKYISELFSLADNCARAVEGHAWHSQPTPEGGKASKPESNATTQSSGKNKNRKKKSNNNNKQLVGPPTITTIATAAGGGCGPCGDKQLRQPSDSDDGGPRRLVHNTRRHSVEECWEMNKLLEMFHEQQK